MDVAGALCCSFGLSHALEQLVRSGTGRYLEHEVPEVVLDDATDRLAVVHPRHPMWLCGAHDGYAQRQEGTAVAQIGAQ